MTRVGRPPQVRHEINQPDDASIKLIALTQGKTATVDAEDYQRLMQSSWCAWWSGNSWYAQARRNGKITCTAKWWEFQMMSKLTIVTTDTL